MKSCLFAVLFLFVIILGSMVVYLGLRDSETRKMLVFFLPGSGDSSSPEKTAEGASPRSPSVPKQSLTNIQSNESSSGGSKQRSTTTSAPKREVLNQYWDADKAFAMDELFAVTSKNTIRREFYTDRFDKNPFGNPTTKFLQPVYIVRAMGRETRENYLFIVTREFYDKAKTYQKFSKAELSNFEYFLSEDKLEAAIFHRRFRARMID